MRLLTIIFLLITCTVNAQIGGRFWVTTSTAPVNQAPTANAGVNGTITLPTNSTGLVGSGTDADGYISSYSWVQISGTSTTVSNANISTPSIAFTIAGVYQYQLTVTDNNGATGKDTVSVTVNAAANLPPIVIAGANIEITAPVSTTTLTGSATDPDGTISLVVWTKSGTAGGSITSPNSTTTGLTGLVPGTNTYTLTATDNAGSVSTSSLVVTVLPAVASANGVYTFNVTGSTQTVSAGVFRDDSILIKTLFGPDTLPVGSYIRYWDGTDDAGLPIISPDANYKVKVLTNNVAYTWQGTIGNNSDSMVGGNKYRGYQSINSIAFSGSTGYYCLGYSEGFSSLGKFSTSTPNIRTAFYTSESITGDIKFVTTDGTTVYWAVHDSYSPNNSFVFGTNVSNDAETSFSSGVSYGLMWGKTYSSVISKANSLNSQITGLTVSANYLFVARGALDQLQVLNKTTGALLQTLSFSNVRGLCVDGADRLWVLYSTNTIQRYTINVGGTLTSISTLSGPVAALSISYGNGLIAVCDGSTSQQTKFYNYTTSALSSTLGTAGGYQSDATVSNSKFMFSDARVTYPSFVAWQSDNSYWVGDVGNSRAQHYNSSNVFVNRIAFLGPTYSTWIDRNNITRAFARYLEFDIDYSVQTLTGSTGWTLTKNWGANVTSTYNDSHDNMRPITLSNGRTYGLIQAGINLEVIELVSGGTMRFTGVNKNTNTGGWFLCTDGSLQLYRDSANYGIVTRYPLTGFDGSNNPTWSSAAEYLATALRDDNAPAAVGNSIAPPKNQVFSTTNKIVFFNYKLYSNNTGPVVSSGYHLGSMQRGANNAYLFQTEKSTHRSYIGDYPKASRFDVGNSVTDFAGGNVNIVDSIIVTSYHGEAWKLTQTNKYNVYYLNGLPLGQFGTTRPQTTGQSPSMMAGNTLTPVMVDAGDSLYLYGGDESDHSGIHRWKINGLNTIAVQSTTIAYPTAYVAPSLNYTDLMAGLPWDSPLANNTAGWTRSPAADTSITWWSDQWKIRTSAMKFDRLSSVDLYTEFGNPGLKTYTLSRDLGTNNVSTNWKITGNVNFGNMPNGLGNNVYLEVLDVTGKLLTTLSTISWTEAAGLYGNTVKVLATALPTLSSTNAFEINIVAGTVNFTYGGYAFTPTTISDGTGDWTKPKTLRVRFNSNGGSNNQVTNDISDLQFYKDY